MSEADKIMRKRAGLRSELYRVLPADQADEIWDKATDRLSDILQRYSALPEGVRSHTDKKIFPSAAVYLASRERLSKADAYSVIENFSFTRAEKAGKMLAALMRLPCLRHLFIRMWDPLTRRMFSERCGFENVFYPEKKDEYRMDVVSCPYFRYFTELGCPELTKIYCGCDDCLYGDLPGIEFVRTSTLGRGGELCDFCIRLK